MGISLDLLKQRHEILKELKHEDTDWCAAKESSELCSPSPSVDSKHVGAFIQNRSQLKRACQRALLSSLLSPPVPIP